MKQVKKVWGKELTVVNKEYAGKVLVIDKGAISSLHRHLVKDEVMLCIEGEVLLVLDDKTYWLKPYDDPVHIVPKSWHMFLGLENSRVAEFSTKHKDEDVERRTQSRSSPIGEN